MFSNLVAPLQTFAAGCTKPSVLGLHAWYNYLPLAKDTTGTCSITFTSNQPQDVLGLHSPFLLVGLAVIDDLLVIAAYVAVGYVIWGGMQYSTSQGSPDKTKKAQGTIINALIGLVVAILAASIVSYVGSQLGGGNQSGLPNPNPATAVSTILDTFVFPIAASISILMAVIGGFKYVVSNGDPNAAASAKNTILYAIIGLIVVMAAYSIVTFVVKGIG